MLDLLELSDLCGNCRHRRDEHDPGLEATCLVNSVDEGAGRSMPVGTINHDNAPGFCACSAFVEPDHHAPREPLGTTGPGLGTSADAPRAGDLAEAEPSPIQSPTARTGGICAPIPPEYDFDPNVLGAHLDGPTLAPPSDSEALDGGPLSRREWAERHGLAEPILTADEHACVDALTSAFRLYFKLERSASTGEADLAEFAARIHDLQARVLARAAHRAYPSRYRLL